jgi:hypothetical protein
LRQRAHALAQADQWSGDLGHRHPQPDADTDEETDNADDDHQNGRRMGVRGSGSRQLVPLAQPYAVHFGYLVTQRDQEAVAFD